MRYLSTRGGAPTVGFEESLLAGLAPDGGLYIPADWPRLTAADIAGSKNLPYAAVAALIMFRFAGEAVDYDRLMKIAVNAYRRFDSPDVAPVKKIGDEDYILELFHGPTLAFKDFAMQLLGGLFEDVLSRRGKRLTIIVATSGDTGAAAIEALKSCKALNIVVLHPNGRITDVQRRMMTTVDAENVLNIAIDGSFDDCQAIVKRLFADAAFAKSVALGGVNSINWARLAAQTVYYVSSYAAVAEAGERVSFVAPTGNFGDIFSGYIAKKMGLPVKTLGVAVNCNDILHRAMTAGDYTLQNVMQTSSPSMDIQVASNFERLLYEANKRDGAAVRKKMENFARARSMILTAEERTAIAKDFVSFAVSEAETKNEISQTWKNRKELIDPHTAVACAATRRLRQQGALAGKVITLATAHPAKFPQAVKAATGVTPTLPARFLDLFDKPERLINVANDASKVKEAVFDHVKAGS